MSILSRPYQKFDFLAICELLIESYTIHQNLQNWSIRHWEGQVYHYSNINSFSQKLSQLWEIDGKLIAFAHSEYDGSVFLQLMPFYPEIEETMLSWAQENLSISKDGCRTLETWAYEDDERRRNLLLAAGFEQKAFFMNCRSCTAIGTIPLVALPKGYHIRGMKRNQADCEAMAALLNAAFQRNFHTPQEYANFQTAPHYRPEFDLVAIAPDGTIAANAQLTLVLENGYAEFEPVCTHPEHQRKGLARALMAEGLQILKTQAIQKVYVDAAGDNPASNALYEQMGFTEVRRLFVWEKIWDKLS
jgi:mycothiol synthase